jgi:hypothetical protein
VSVEHGYANGGRRDAMRGQLKKSSRFVDHLLLFFV